MLSTSQLESLTALALEYRQALSAEAFEYLVKERGISRDIIGRYGLGTVVGDHPSHEQYQGWISIPYITASNTVVGFKFRRIGNADPRFGSPAGQKSHLFNVRDIQIESDTIVLCEGELDTIIVSGMLEVPAVGCPGVASWKPHYAKLFAGYDRVIIVGDNDDKENGTNPGQDFSRRVAQEVQNSTIVLLPTGMDISDYYLTEGADKLRERLGL